MTPSIKPCPKSAVLKKAARLAQKVLPTTDSIPLTTARVNALFARGDYASVLDVTRKFDLVSSVISTEQVSERAQAEWTFRQTAGLEF